jgi:hypothetical protein
MTGQTMICVDGWTLLALLNIFKKEVDKREILCYGGVEVASLPTEVNLSSSIGTVFPSPGPDLIKEDSPDKDKSHSY